MTSSTSSTPTASPRPTVGLFVTCLVDLFRPGIGFAAVRLLEQAGCTVVVPDTQTCCGQPAYNSGDRADTQAIASQVIDSFADFDYIVAPSGSCAAMIKEHYPQLFDVAGSQYRRARALADKTHELVSFLVDVLGIDSIDAEYHGTVTYHDSCSGLRELGIKQQPRRLLSSVRGLTLTEMTDSEVCCGFGGTFCIKYPEISNNMVSDKMQHIEHSKADMVLAGDLGCLLNIAGKLKRENSPVAIRHIAEVLAQTTDTPGIGES